MRGAFDLWRPVREDFPALSLVVESSWRMLASKASSSEHPAWQGNAPFSGCLMYW